jgi:hypothetical protein
LGHTSGEEELPKIAFETIEDDRAILHQWIHDGGPGGFLTAAPRRSFGESTTNEAGPLI